MSRVRKMIAVLERRETKSRLALARLTRCLEQQRARIRVLQQLIDALLARVQLSLAERYASGVRTVAALQELEQHVRALRASTEQVAALKERAQHQLDQLAARQRLAAREWRRTDLRLGHVAGLAREERIASSRAAGELDDEEHAERRAAAARAT